MTHAQKEDFVFQRNGRVHFNRRGRQYSRLLAAEVRASAVVMFRGSVKSTGFSLHSSVSPSLLLSCVTVCHHISTGLYWKIDRERDWRIFVFSTQCGFITSEITHTVAIKTVKYERENFVWIEYDVTVISGEFPKHEMEGRCFGWRRTTRRTCSTDMLVICVTSQPNGPNHCLVYNSQPLGCILS